MNRQTALDKLLDFMHAELGTPYNMNPWKIMRGDRICLECTKHKRSTLYMLVTEEAPLIFNCFRASCGMSRLVREKDLLDLGFRDTEAIAALINSDITKKVRTYNTASSHIVVRDLILTADQLEYFNKRCGFYPSYDDIAKYRIIPNIREVMYDNKLNNSPAGLEVYNKLTSMSDKISITFTNDDFDMFMTRSIVTHFRGLFTTNKDKRFLGYTLKRGEKIKNIVMCEGIFDIINIYNRFAIIDDTLYIATCGFNNTIPILKYYYRKHIDTLETFIIFMDSDIKLDNGKYMYKKYMLNNILKGIKKEIGENAFNTMWMVYNTKSKDFGDMSDEFGPVKIQLK